MATTTTEAAAPAHTGAALGALGTVFFMWGLVTVLNDVLVPHLKAVFDLSYTQALLIQFAFFSAYFLFSIPAARIIERIGYRNSVLLGLGVMGLGALGFIPAAMSVTYGVFLGALLVLAAGVTLLQVAANPYVAAMGPPETASSRLVLVQALNSLGTTVGPAIGGWLILGDTVSGAAQVELPYLIIAGVLFVLAFAISRFPLPTLASIEAPPSAAAGDSVLRHPNLVFGIVAIFVYVGAEVAIGSTLVNYLELPDVAAMSAATASGYLSFYWGGALIGRFVGSWLLRSVPTGPLVATCAVGALALVVTSILTTGHVAMWSMLAVGLCNSIMFPSIFTLGVARLGALTTRGSMLLIMAIVGGAIIPELEALLADQIGLHPSYVVAGVCYLYIIFYGLVGSRPVRHAA